MRKIGAHRSGYTREMTRQRARDKVVTTTQLVPALERARAAKARIVLTNGCFDVLHLGHVRYLEQAATLGDLLVVGVNGDHSVRLLKGAGRPLVPEQERAEVLAALAVVDYVVIFSEPTAESLVRLVRPDIYVKGGDYQVNSIPEARLARELGAEVRVVDLQPGRSTSALVQAIRARSKSAGGE